MTYYIVHYMNNYKNLHDILHEITCHSMELVLVPTSWTRLRLQDLRLPPPQGVPTHPSPQSLHSIMSSTFLTELEFPPRSSHKDSTPNTG